VPGTAVEGIFQEDRRRRQNHVSPSAYLSYAALRQASSTCFDVFTACYRETRFRLCLRGGAELRACVARVLSFSTCSKETLI
jgi:hypothetical protein